MIYRTKALASEFENFLISKIKNIDSLPVLNIIQVGSDFASTKYIEFKVAKCNELNVPINVKKYEISTNPKIVEGYLNSLSDSNCGVMIQIPLPPAFDYLIDKIDPKVDVDLLSPHSEIFEKNKLLAPTIGAIDIVLKKILFESDVKFSSILQTKLDLSGKTIAVIGQGKLVGRPLLSYLQARGGTIVSINKDTVNPKELTIKADILITAAGVENLIDSTWLKKDAIVIDAATLESDGGLKGDVNKNQLNEDTILCPSPGGIGRLTILYIIYNLFTISGTI
jgi:methylenetetrahydrofolate dehydrogenase (NADP+) / methenyltetrahydrofolate cyclohydrolase